MPPARLNLTSPSSTQYFLSLLNCRPVRSHIKLLFLTPYFLFPDCRPVLTHILLSRLLGNDTSPFFFHLSLCYPVSDSLSRLPPASNYQRHYLNPPSDPPPPPPTTKPPTKPPTNSPCLRPTSSAYSVATKSSRSYRAGSTTTAGYATNVPESA